MILRLHSELKQGFVYQIQNCGFIDADKQMAHAATAHWALSMSEDHYSQIKEIFYHQIIWTTKCLNCQHYSYTFAISDVIAISEYPTIEGPITVTQLLEFEFSK